MALGRWRKQEYEKADKIYLHDRLLEKTFLKLIPAHVTPNQVTIFRFITTPLVAILMLSQYYYVGLIAFLIVAFSDAVDGSMARVRGQITKWGKIYDPLADKILIGSMVFIIVFRYIDFWTAIIIISVEFFIILSAWYRLRKGDKVQANLWGKIKMFLEVLGVVILLLSIVFSWASLLPLASGTFYLAIAFAIVSLLTYSS